jgi:hypothetical protein
MILTAANSQLVYQSALADPSTVQRSCQQRHLWQPPATRHSTRNDHSRRTGRSLPPRPGPMKHISYNWKPPMFCEPRELTCKASDIAFWSFKALFQRHRLYGMRIWSSMAHTEGYSRRWLRATWKDTTKRPRKVTKMVGRNSDRCTNLVGFVKWLVRTNTYTFYGVKTRHQIARLTNCYCYFFQGGIAQGVPSTATMPDPLCVPFWILNIPHSTTIALWQ